MNNFKNFVIFILSLIILIQSALIIYFISNKGIFEKQKREYVRKPEAEKKVPLVKEPEMAVVRKPHVIPSIPATIEKGKIALVIDDWGYNLKNKDFIAGNDFHVTLSVLPFRAYSTQIAQIARQHNKDVIVHMPMEPHHKENYDLEENTLMVGMDRNDIMRLLRNAFDSVPFARGISNHMGSAATENPRLMRIVMMYLKERDFFFFDSYVTSKSVCRSIAARLSVKYAQRDVFIDNESDLIYIREQLQNLAQKAKNYGVAIGIGHDRPNTIAVLKEMIPKLQAQGYVFVNVSELETI